MGEMVLPAGTLLGGDFELTVPIASGGMGAVYLATQRSTGATRAVKVMHAHLAHDADFRRRFTQEANVATRIESEHVVQVLAANIDDTLGVPWLAMEYLRGETLESYVHRKGRLSLGELLELFLQVGHGVGAAHRAGIVHRDLKPENIFVSPSLRVGETYSVKVLDFGIAKICSPDDAAARSTSALGTPLWMAPEQLRMAGDIDARADVWALGLIAFYCLTGKSYWRNGNVEAIDLAALVNEVAFGPLTNASVRAGELGAPGLPAAVREWFERCTDRDRTRRYANAQVAVQALVAGARAIEGFAETVAAGSTTGQALVQAVTVPPPGSEQAAGPKARANRFLVAGALVLVAGAVGVALVRLRPRAASSAEEIIRDDTPMVGLAGGLMHQGRDDGPVDERPTHEVSVAGFSMDQHEVTAAAYEACVAHHACAPPGTGDDCNAGRPERRNDPINCVDFERATAYCRAHDARLPTEAEWEFAARSGTQGLYPWGTEPPDTGRACFGRAEGHAGTCPVGAHPGGRSIRGIDDLAGNVWEWTSSAYCPYASPWCQAAERVARGGSFASGTSGLLSTTTRIGFLPTTKGSTLGFRCVRTR